MFEKFGEFDSAEELNRAALAQRNEGDAEAVRALAEENGLDSEDAEEFLAGDVDFLALPFNAAVGKLTVERSFTLMPSTEPAESSTSGSCPKTASAASDPRLSTVMST